MKPLFSLFAFICTCLVIASCNKTPLATEVQVYFEYSLDTSSGLDMTKATNDDIFNEFYAKMKTAALVADEYTITLTEVTTGTKYEFQGSWNAHNMVTVLAGTYRVEGWSTAAGGILQDKCSLIFEDSVTIDASSNVVTLPAKYDCFLLVFNGSTFSSLKNINGDATEDFFDFNAYKYAFVNDRLYTEDNKAGAHILGSFTDGALFKVYTGSLTFEKGKYYVYNSVAGGFAIPEMEAGNPVSGAAGQDLFVDLGLPSGLLWATCNIGANSPEEPGAYFGWGEVEPNSHYNWDNYRFWNGSSFSKYNSQDGLTQLDLVDDAAHIIWKGDWRMPTHDEELELANNCSIEQMTLNGVLGYKFTGPNGNYLFFPLGGVIDGTDYDQKDNEPVRKGNGGWYWSSTLNAVGSAYASGFCFWPSLMLNVSDHERCDGHMIRPVKCGTGTDENVVSIALPPDDEIWYESHSGKTIPLAEDSSLLVSNTYSNGKGIYKFSKALTEIGGMFDYSDQCGTTKENEDFKSLILPKNITHVGQFGISHLCKATKLVLPFNLSSMGSDCLCGFGEWTEETSDIYFIGDVAPSFVSTSIWNMHDKLLNGNKIDYFHYPENNNSYDLLLQITIQGSATHYWVPTKYIITFAN